MNYNTIESLLESAVPAQSFDADRQKRVEKWAKTGLLKGLSGSARGAVATLLENQAAQMLSEVNTMGTGGGNLVHSGQIVGFAKQVFPMVRRVFGGGVIANKLVSVQPMPLPHGLIFYTDAQYANDVAGVSVDPAYNASYDDTEGTYAFNSGKSIYGGRSGKDIQKGNILVGGQYELQGQNYTRYHTSSPEDAIPLTDCELGAWVGTDFAWEAADGTAGVGYVDDIAEFESENQTLVGSDPRIETDLEEGRVRYTFLMVPVASIKTAFDLTSAPNVKDSIDFNDLSSVGIHFKDSSSRGDIRRWNTERYQSAQNVVLMQHSRRGTWNSTDETWTNDPFDGTHVLFVLGVKATGANATLPDPTDGALAFGVTVPLVSALEVFDTGASVAIPELESNVSFTNPQPSYPEINVKVEAINIVAKARKIKMRFTHEFAQDYKAYHNGDIEVLLTRLMSEQIAREIDTEILADLMTQAAAANYYWSKAPGKFVDKATGKQKRLGSALDTGPSFTGPNNMWYQTLVETMNWVSAEIQTKTLMGAANFAVTSPFVCAMLMSLGMFRTEHSVDSNGQFSNEVKIRADRPSTAGTLADMYEIHRDPRFPRNKILMGYKGSDNLESGYVYAPYVPLIMTPTVLHPLDFTPSKGAMTRYGKKMIRADFYATVTILDFSIT